MPTYSHKSSGIKIKPNKSVKVKIIAIPKSLDYHDLELHVTYDCENGQFSIGRKFKEAKFIQEDDGFIELKMNKHFFTTHMEKPYIIYMSITEENKIRPLDTEFFIHYEYVKPPEFGIESEGEDY